MKTDTSAARAPLPLPTIRRYPIYIRTIRAMMDEGETNISSAVVSARLGLDPVLTRKDFALAGVAGRPRLGYPAKAIAEAMMRTLGWDNPTDAVLVGAGSLGTALLGYQGFREQKLSIVVAFDADPAIAGRTFHGVKVLPMEEMQPLIRRLHVKMGILTVPADAAQACADALVAAGIRGIWNFTVVRLHVPNGVIVQNTDLAQSLAELSHAIAQHRKK